MRHADIPEGCLLVSPPPVSLYFDERDRILRGVFAGRSVDEVAQQILEGYRAADRQVRVRRAFAWPWWRLWKATRVLTLTVYPQVFEDDLDDGTPW